MKGKATDESHDEGRSRSSVGLLGPLHWLWEEAQLNAWRPQFPRRTWRECHARLRRRLREATINGQGLDEVLYSTPPVLLRRWVPG